MRDYNSRSTNHNNNSTNNDNNKKKNDNSNNNDNNNNIERALAATQHDTHNSPLYICDEGVLVMMMLMVARTISAPILLRNHVYP